MTPNEFLKLAKAQLNKWNLNHWKVTFGNSKYTCGLTHYEKETIFFSLPNFYELGEDEAIDTLLHEIAHCLAAERNGCYDHGEAWRKWALMLGARI